ncbi:MAG: dTDP-4-dehydrorhamnose reductase [Flavobacterium sp. BFFFF1]|uniref:dTDP-4-dehydrorhamnose reductase n=1 Tax=Flavobacterium sp. BFFFF1 TaxID=2015557 RepID=UPI000BD91B13|nr:dTDP-4-dehydrorhamnose reductase [Flavobacterium sp. BFFFF1]OYU81335.1 MAG: dTDP-4-dehydrorhamnose reductase [Flavobacterium sp. BFFFF1]
MVVLVTGADGQLGKSLRYIAEDYPQIQFLFFNSQQLDITDSRVVNSVFAVAHPDFCINAAAYTAVDRAENEAETAHQINVIGPQNLAYASKKEGTILIQISTDFIFDGNSQVPYTERDRPNPMSVYGRTKLEGEKAVEKEMERFFIIRTSWVYSQFGNNFMKTMMRLASERESLNVVDDQVGTPTHAVDLAKTLLRIIISTKEKPEHKLFGIYNFSNEGQCTWYEFAKKIFEINHVEIQLNAIVTERYPTPAKRPKYSVLNKDKIKSCFGIVPEYWDVSLENYNGRLL